jgi:hypothetical protein
VGGDREKEFDSMPALVTIDRSRRVCEFSLEVRFLLVSLATMPRTSMESANRALAASNFEELDETFCAKFPAFPENKV